MSWTVNAKNVLGSERQLPCPHCHVNTNHTVAACVSKHDANEDGDQWWERFEIVRCLGCDCHSFRQTSSSTDDYDFSTDELRETEVLFPSRVAGRAPLQRSYHLPTAVRRIYRETHAALCSSQPILAGIGVRALIEAVCRENKAGGKNLEKQIDDLVSKGILTKPGAEILHSTRLLGNKAAHEVTPPTDEELSAAIEVAENLLENVYILPAVAARLPKPKQLGTVNTVSTTPPAGKSKATK